MVQIAGKYQHVSNENLVAHFVALGLPEESAKKADAISNALEVTVEGAKVTISADTPSGPTTNVFVLGKETEEKILTITLKSVAKLDGDTLTINSTTPTGKAQTRVYKFSDSGIDITLSSTDSAIPQAKRRYKRV